MDDSQSNQNDLAQNDLAQNDLAQNDLADTDMAQAVKRPLIVRIVVVFAGTILVLAGIIGLLLPVVPGWLLIIPGLAILATEFVWARNLLDTAREKAALVRAKVPGNRKSKTNHAA